MRNFWLVAKHEFLRMVIRRGFLVGTLAIPLAMVFIIGLAIAVEKMGESDLPLGYVDYADILDVNLQVEALDAEEGIEIRAYPDEERARTALESGEIQAYFVFPAEYLETLHTDLYYLEEAPSNDVWGQLDDFVRINLVAELPEDIGHRLLEGPNITVLDIVSKRTFSQKSMINIILPIVASFFFFITTMSSSGYMLKVVADEKENRTIEIMVTSITPGQLIGGKAAGLMATVLTQLSIYITALAVGVNIAASNAELLEEATVPWEYIGVMVIFFIPAYTLISVVMVAIGAAVQDMQQGQQVSGLLNMIFMFPIFALMLILENPAHPFVVFLSLFPTSAFLTISLRWGLGSIPMWQIGVSWVLLVATTIFMVWAAARIFRAGMLRYGQSLKLRSVVAAIKGAW